MATKRLTEDGFTLIEILVAIAILAIMIAALTPLFISSFTGIFTAGRKSGTQYLVQQEIEKAIAGDSGADATFIPSTSIEGISGTIVEVQKEYESGKIVTVKTFVREQPVWLQFSGETYIGFDYENTIDIRVTRKGILASTATVYYETVGITTTYPAIIGTHYNATSGTLQFLPGETEKTFAVNVLEFDSAAGATEPDVYAVGLRLSSPTSTGGYNALLGFPNEAILYISDYIEPTP
ncbi:MAG: Calx-beta domain-containing protein [Bacillota bacterium]|nr:Calx-beta domain-containing protein [Bacillota bacterium]MDW7683213.1 Calx-beta domain-containing protein [Bacillota bacterium]